MTSIHIPINIVNEKKFSLGLDFSDLKIIFYKKVVSIGICTHIGDAVRYR